MAFCSFPFFFFHACIPGTPQSALKGKAAILTCRSSPAGGVLIAVVPAVIVAVTGPVVWDAAAAGALELGVGAGPDAAHFIAAVPAVVICNHAQNDYWRLDLSWRKLQRLKKKNKKHRRVCRVMWVASPESQRHCALMHRPLEQLNWVSGSQVGKAETGRLHIHVNHKVNKSCNK